MLTNSKEVVQRLSKDLGSLDLERVVKLVETFGLYGAARILGFDVSHYNYLLLAGRLAIEDLKQKSPKDILSYANLMKKRLHPQIYQFIVNNHESLQEAINKNEFRDYDHDWFSANTMITMYSANVSYGQSGIETPQYTWMRIAIQLYFDSKDPITNIVRAYEEMSQGWYTPASPTIFNAGMIKPQMSSCFLLTIGDNLESILKNGIYRGGMISKESGGLGFDVSRVRHSEIKEIGWSSGIIPMLQLYNYMVRYVDQCFTNETVVYTEAGPKCIEEIVSGDRVVTRDGSLQDVKFVMTHDYDNDIVEVTVNNTFRPIRVAPSHPILVIRNQETDISYATILARIGRGSAKPEWADAYTLTDTDLVAFPVPTIEKDIPDYIDTDMYMYGLMISSGQLVDGRFSITLVTNLHGHIIDFVHKYLVLRNIRFTENIIENTSIISWSSGSNFRFNKTSLYEGDSKRIHPNFLHLPKNKSFALIAGILYRNTLTDSWRITCSTKDLPESIRYILLRMGVATKGEVTLTPEETYTIIIPKVPELCSKVNNVPSEDVDYLLHEGIIWNRVISVSTPTNYKGKIYDLEINNNHNYLTHMGLAHNGGRRKGAATIFLRTHHIDLEDFIELPRKVGDKYARAHDLNICLWTSWIFWERVRTNGNWTLFCPAKTSHLNDLYGDEFTKAYIATEQDPNISSKHKKVISARSLYDSILNIQRETGMPYIMNGDAANIKSNHRHLGYIRSSNLCLEVIEYTDDNTIAVCNLHSLSLRMFGKGPVDHTNSNLEDALRKSFDFPQLSNISRRVVENLNAVIDHNHYPLDKIVDGKVVPKIINKSNKKHRPVGMGVSGFAELLHILDLPFEHPTVNVLNKMIFACMYWNALAQSVQLSIKDGSYDSFVGSPTSEGKLQFDLWKEEFKIVGPNAVRKEEDDNPIDPSTWQQEAVVLYDVNDNVVDTVLPTWDDLKRVIIKYGLRNSLLIALMPTASTAQVRRNCESVEAHQNNMYSRKVLKCSYPVLNRYLVRDLEELGVWNKSVVEYIKIKNGSIQGVNRYVINNPLLFPKFTGDVQRLIFLELKYKTMWEIPQKAFMRLAAERGRYIDQSSSTNVYIRDCTDDKLRACHIYANMSGLKTIMYYLRQTGGETIKFTADPNMISYINGIDVEVIREEKKEVQSKSVQIECDIKLVDNKPMMCDDHSCCT